MIKVAEIRTGDVFSEISHYCVKSVDKNKISLIHLQTKKEVELTPNYVCDLLKTADQYQKEIIVGKEDKKWTKKQIEDAVKKGEIKPDSVTVGDVKQKGIKTIWNDIHSSQVFTVCFKKSDKDKSKKEFEAERLKKLEEYKNSTNKESFVLDLINKPILSYVEGEERILRGYKVQFNSEDGSYDCIDMDITDKLNIRPVNLNSLLWLVFDGVKYTLE